MEDKLVTLAIHTYQKAQIMKTILESDGIEVYLHNVNLIQPVISSGVRVRIKESDLPSALKIIESTDLVNQEQILAEVSVEKKKTVLIPIDYSEYSKQACEIGFKFAHEIGAEVVLLHAYFVPVFSNPISLGDNPVYPMMEDEESMVLLAQKAQKELEEFSLFIQTKMAEKEWSNVSFSSLLRNGIPEDEIDYYCKKNDPVMVFMGTRGKSQKDLDLIGSVTAEVIDRSKVPVFVIPENTPFKSFSEIKKIAFGTSFDQKDLLVVDSLFKLLKNYNIEYSLFHISNRQDAWNEVKLAGLKDYFEKQYPGMSISCEIIRGNDLVLDLEKFVRNNHIDVISLSTHKRNIFARIFNPSIARKMLFHTDTPLLVLHS